MSYTPTEFVNYAHRGASHYCPENTFMSFYMGMHMGANGIETDVQRTRDGVLVLFHDDTLKRVTGEEGAVADYTYGELLTFSVKHGALTDKIPTLDDFLSHFGHRDITFAIELKVDGIEREVAEAVYRHGVEKKTVITSFGFDRVRITKELYPSLRVGYLTWKYGEELERKLLAMGADEICPKGCDVTREAVERWHAMGLGVRAWGIADEEIMKAAYDAGVDGMTVNFPDLLVKYRLEK